MTCKFKKGDYVVVERKWDTGIINWMNPMDLTLGQVGIVIKPLEPNEGLRLDGEAYRVDTQVHSGPLAWGGYLYYAAALRLATPEEIKGYKRQI